VKEIDAIFNLVFDQHPLGVATNQAGGRLGPVVGHEQARLLVAQLGDGQLP